MKLPLVDSNKHCTAKNILMLPGRRIDGEAFKTVSFLLQLLLTPTPCQSLKFELQFLRRKNIKWLPLKQVLANCIIHKWDILSEDSPNKGLSRNQLRVVRKIKKLNLSKGGAVAEWSKALLQREKINEYQKDPRFAPRPGHLLKKVTSLLQSVVLTMLSAVGFLGM